MKFNRNFNYNEPFSCSEPWRNSKSYEARMQKMKRLLTVEEYELLTGFDINYTEEEFIKYTDILGKLEDAGIFRITGDPVADEAISIVTASSNSSIIGRNNPYDISVTQLHNLWDDDSVEAEMEDTSSIFDDMSPDESITEDNEDNGETNE